MIQSISGLLGPAVGIAISPLPIVGLVLILLSNEARKNSLGYTLGWLLGNAGGFLIGALLFSGASDASSDPGMAQIIIKLLLGAGLVFLAVKKFMSLKQNAGAAPKTPKWFDSIATLSIGKAFMLAVILSLVNPKNLALSLAAGTGFAALDQGTTALIINTVVFMILAGVTIMVPTALFFVKGESLKPALDTLQVWLIGHNDIIMAVMLLILGVNVISGLF